MWRKAIRGINWVSVKGSPFCFPGCFERELHKLYREGVLSAVHKPSHSRRAPLGLLLLSRGKITNQQLQHALDVQKKNSQRYIGEWLRQLGYASDDDIAAALAVQWSCPLLKKIPLQISEHAVPLHLLQTLRMVSLYSPSQARVLHVAFADKVDHLALLAIEQMLGCKTEACLTTPTELQAALAYFEERKPRNEKIFERSNDPAEVSRIVSSYISRMDVSDVRAAWCRQIFWVRIKGENNFVDMLFPRTPGQSSGLESERVLQQAVS